jgi:O-Antigen ligase
VALEALRPAAATDRRLAMPRGAAVAATLVAFGPVVGLAGAQGGFFPSAWGWATLPLLWVVAVALALRQRVRLSGAELAFIGLVAAVAAWILLSAAWSVAPAASILESQRGLVYVAAIAAALVVARSRYVGQVLGGVLAAIAGIAAFSLATRIFPDRVGVFEAKTVYRLAQPIGYWNGLAIFCGMGALLALGFAARARTVLARAAGAAALVLLMPTLYFTFGRGPWIALAAGLVAAVAVDPRRLQLLLTLFAVAPASAAAVWLASRRSGLTHANATLSQATHDGHRLALFLLLLGLANAAVGVALALVERRVRPGPAARALFATAVALVVLGGLSTVFVRYGGPVTLAKKGYNAFKAPSPHPVNLNRRLLSFSGNGRADLWRLAWDDAKRHELAGTGAGTYERYFLAHQPAKVGRVRDAHGLYVETLAELGGIGLMMLLAALAVPFLVLRRGRGHPFVPAATGAYVAYLVHAGVDWDWELPAVTLAGLLCGASLLLAARRAFRSPPLNARLRWGGVAAAVAVSLAAAVGLTGNMALSRSNKALRHRDWARAAADARTARSWMPWSPAPWEALGRAQLGAGLVADGQKSFRKALSMDRGDWELWYRLATASRGAVRRHAIVEAARLFPRAGFLRSS